MAAARPAIAVAQQDLRRPVRLEWNEARTELNATLSFRDLIDGPIRQKLTRGLPTTIVVTATLHQAGRPEPLATTAQSCKITWHVWEEAYRVEMTRPGGTHAGWTTTLAGVLRRCAELSRLVVARSNQVPRDALLSLKARLVINPVSPEILQQIRRWVSRPVATATAAPGDALFSTFAGLFLRQIGDAERELEFETKPQLPVFRTQTRSAKGDEP